MVTRYSLKSGFQIYFLTIVYEDKVYAFGSGLGFTDVIYGYAIAETEDQAIALAYKKYDLGSPKVRNISASCSHEQNLSGYYFPENMAGIQQGTVMS